MTLAELERLEQRQANGGELDEQDGARLDQAQQAVREGVASVAAAVSTMWSTKPEDRSPEQYRAQVQQYADRLGAALRPQNSEPAPTDCCSHASLVISNDTPTNLPDVRFVVHVRATPRRRNPTMKAGGLPQPRRRTARGGWSASALVQALGHAWLRANPGASYLGRVPCVEIENHGSATLRFAP